MSTQEITAQENESSPYVKGALWETQVRVVTKTDHFNHKRAGEARFVELDEHTICHSESWPGLMQAERGDLVIEKSYELIERASGRKTATTKTEYQIIKGGALSLLEGKKVCAVCGKNSGKYGLLLMHLAEDLSGAYCCSCGARTKLLDISEEDFDHFMNKCETGIRFCERCRRVDNVAAQADVFLYEKRKAQRTYRKTGRLA